MPPWIRYVLDLVLVLYCIYGADLINRHFFNGDDYGIRFALVVAVLYVVGYPIWGWKRNSAWRFIGRWSFPKWVISGIAVGMFVVLVEFFADVVVHHYSAQ